MVETVCRTLGTLTHKNSFYTFNDASISKKSFPIIQFVFLRNGNISVVSALAWQCTQIKCEHFFDLSTFLF